MCGNISRSRLFLALFLLVTLNSMAGLATRAVTEQGWANATLVLFNISAILWAALFAGLKILHEDSSSLAPSRADISIAWGIVLLCLVPLATVSMGALSLLAIYAILTSSPASPLRRSAIIFLAMTGPLIWGRIILALFSGPILGADALFVATLLGAEQRANMLWLEGGAMRLVVAPGCSSLQGMSIALLLWVTINQLFEVRFGLKPALWCLAALAATVAINVLRIAGMLILPDFFDVIHTGWGFHLLMWITLVAVAVITIYGARREIFAPR